MPDHQVDLPGAIHLIPSLRFVEKLAEQRARYPFLPDVEGVRGDLSVLASRGPVPARVESGRGGRGDFLKIYIDGRYVLTLNVTKRGNGYSVSGAFPMGFEHHDEVTLGHRVALGDRHLDDRALHGRGERVAAGTGRGPPSG